LKGFRHIIVDNLEFASIDQPLQALQIEYQKLKNRFGGIVVVIICHTPKLFDGLTISPEVKTIKGERVGVRSLVRNTFGVEGHVGALGWGLGRLTSNSIIHTDLHKPNNKLVSA
jgi:hypothetical protein